MSGFNSSKELYINMSPKDIPYWNPRLPYWEQSVEAIQFWQAEADKIVNGVNLGGYYMNGWMYFHLNHFTTMVMNVKTKKNEIRTPIFDDNVYFLMECYNKAVKEGKGFAMWGTRGFAKTTFMGSHEYFTHFCRQGSGGTSVIIGGTAGDMTGTEDMFYGCQTRIHPALKLNIMSGNRSWSKETDIIIGNETSSGEKLISSKIRLINAEGGTETASEKAAGFTPIGFKMDEIGKFDPVGIFESAKISFKQSGVSTFTFILAGTGGNAELSEGAKKMLLNPDDYDISIMNWDLLNNMVPEEHITWKEDIGKKFSTFVPGHMSYRDNSPKLETTFGEFSKGKYLNKELNNLYFKKTDWEGANRFYFDKYNSLSDDKAKNKLRMYLPRNISDTFLVNKSNVFDKEKIIEKLEEIRRQPKYELIDFEISQDGIIKKTFSNSPLAGRKYEGKPISAPFMVFEGFPEEIPGRFNNVSAADDYKSDDSTTGSLGSNYVLKRRTSTEPLERIIACITERPSKHNDLYKKWEKLIRATNALCNLELPDANFISYLENVLKVNPSYYLHPFINPYQELNAKAKKNASTYKWGVYPTKENKNILLREVITYTQESFNAGFDPDTNMPIIKNGIDLIEDPWLLQEMLEYEPGANVDRIMSFGWALVLARHMDRIKRLPEDLHVTKYNNDFINKIASTNKSGLLTNTNKIRNF